MEKILCFCRMCELVECPLGDRFSRLFNLSTLSRVSVFDMCQLRWAIDGEAWSWRRGLFVWEQELVGELRLLVQNVILQVDKEDRWILSLESSSSYTVRSVYNYLNLQPPVASGLQSLFFGIRMFP